MVLPIGPSGFFNLDQYVKTELVKQIQKTVIDNHIARNGVSSLSSSVSRKALNAKSRVPNGVAMGEQLNGEFIPIIYGFMGMTNQQFDEGQKPSEIDTEKTVQQIRIPVSEGPIIGMAVPTGGTLYNFDQLPQSTGWNNDVLKSIVVDEQYVIDPLTGQANFKDLKFRMTLGDGTADYLNNGKIEKHNPLISDGTDEDLDITDAANDTITQKKLNDLLDVQAGKGENYVLFWNHATSQWEAKAFNTLLNEAGLTYQGGAGGTGGSGGDGGSGGRGGTGGVGPITGVPLKYTQHNPPPAHVKTQGEFETETTITAYSAPGSVSGTLGAPLRRESATDPYFSTTITDVDDNTNAIKLTFAAPDGMYKEIVTTTTVKNGVIELCGTERPITGSGNLDCLTPDITIADDGQTSTTKTRVAGTARVRYALVTELCGRDFVLHEDTITVSALRNGFYSQTETIYLSEMNAGSGAIVTGPNAGTQQDGPIDDEATPSCDPTDASAFDYANYTLQDYLTTYPNQIIEAADTITVYAYLLDEDEESVSTPVYLQSVCVSDSMDVYRDEYATGETNTSPFFIAAPDYVIAAFEGDTSNANGYSLERERNACNIPTGTYDDTKQPDPLTVLDGNATGSAGDAGTVGTTGTTGTTGSAGQSGTASAPATDPIPSVESSNSIYAGDGVSAVFTLSAATVIHSDALESVTLTISIPSAAGDLDVTTVQGSVSATGRGTHQLTLIGTKANLQTTLDSGLKFTSSTSAQGDIDIDFYISGAGGNSREIYKIRTQAQVEPVAPTFTITISGATGNIRCMTRQNEYIMNTVSASGTINDIAAAVAQEINDDNSIPDWTATASGNLITVTGPTALGDRYNGIIPSNGATGGNLMAAFFTPIGGGVSGSRINQPTVNTTRMANSKNFVKFGSYSNVLNDVNVSWAEVVYRPEQDSGTSNLSEIGIVVAGRRDIQEPINDTFLTFDEWRLSNFNHSVDDISESAEDGVTFSQNAAGHFYEYLTNTRYGLGNEVKLNELPYDNWIQFHQDVYDAMAWCEDYGIKTNGIIFGQESKIEALQNIAAVFAGRFVYVNGYPRLLFEGQCFDQDYTHTNRTTQAQTQYTRSSVVKKLVNQSSAANIVYTSNSIENIFNKITVPYNDRGKLFKTKLATYSVEKESTEYPFDFDRETTVEFWGVGDERLAQFLAAYVFETETANAETVSYVAGWDHYDVFPNDIIMLNDTLRMDQQFKGGRVVSDNGDGTVTLDRDSGGGVIYVTDSHGNVRTGTASGTTATVSPGTGEVYNPETEQNETVTGYFVAGAVWNMEANTENLYRVIAIEESEDGIYAVSAQKHDVDKYDRIRTHADQY
jgi:hypothetical protein